MLRSALKFCVLAIGLAGCTPELPSLDGIGTKFVTKRGLTPGITAAQFEARETVPDGLTIAYRWQSPDQTLNFEFSHSPRSDGGLDLSGRLLLDGAIDVDQEALEAIAAAIDASTEIEGSASELIQQDQIGLPITGFTDERLQLEALRLFTQTTYVPHDCSFTLGECRYKRKEEGQPVENLASIITEEGGIWRQIKIGLNPLGGNEFVVVEESLSSYDKYGLLIAVNGWELTEDGPDTYEVRRQN